MKYATLPFFSQAGTIINCSGGPDRSEPGSHYRWRLGHTANGGFVYQRRPGHRPDSITPTRKGSLSAGPDQANQVPELQVIEEPLFRTNFNQQFILGNFDRRYFEEVYNNFPVARVLRVKNAAAP